MLPKQVIDTASDLGIIVQSIGYVRDFGKWFYGLVKAESLAMEKHLDAFSAAIKKMSHYLLHF
jgi:hypothetical protein